MEKHISMARICADARLPRNSIFCLVDVKAELLRSHFPSFSHSRASPELGGGGGGGGGWGFVPNASQISVRHEA